MAATAAEVKAVKLPAEHRIKPTTSYVSPLAAGAVGEWIKVLELEDTPSYHPG